MHSIDHAKVCGITQTMVQQAAQQTESLLSELSPLIHPDKGPWLFGLDEPTVLDTHLIPFLARLSDIGRTGLIPESLKKYAEVATSTGEFRSSSVNGRTFPQK